MSLRLTSRGMNLPGVWPDLTVTIRGDQLHGPLVERLLELPMDIYEGRLDGELKLRAYDTPSWQFPELYGRIKCRGGFGSRSGAAGTVSVEGWRSWDCGAGDDDPYYF